MDRNKTSPNHTVNERVAHVKSTAYNGRDMDFQIMSKGYQSVTLVFFFCNSWWSIQKYIWIQQIMVVSYLLANIFKIHYKLSIIINVDEQQG